jgi:hypothetical protein
MAKSTKVSADEKLENQDFDLFAAIVAVDKKEYSWFDRLTEEQQRKFTPYMMLQWCTTVNGNKNLTSYYLLGGNEYSNKHMFNEIVQNHPKLQWLMLCAGSPGIGKQYHKWLPHLSNKIGELREEAKLSVVKDYFNKIYSSADQTTINECAGEFTKNQNHKVRLAKMFPQLKISDIEVLSTYVTGEELDEYDRNSGS